jgi:hypothetical protein
MPALGRGHKAGACQAEMFREPFNTCCTFRGLWYQAGYEALAYVFRTHLQGFRR